MSSAGHERIPVKFINCEGGGGENHMCLNVSSDLKGKILLYSQKIFSTLTSTNDYFELLSRNTFGGSIESLLKNLDDKCKTCFDFFVLEELFKLINTLKLTNKKFNINFDPKTISEENIKNRIFVLIEKYDIDPKNISIEITEDGELSHEEMIKLNKNIYDLNNVGIKVGIDDYPNLNNNCELLDKLVTIDFVKIDKSFLLSLKDGDINKTQLIQKIKSLIESIHLRFPDIDIVVEGVENLEIFEILKENFGDSVKYYQGYYFSIPAPIIGK